MCAQIVKNAIHLMNIEVITAAVRCRNDEDPAAVCSGMFASNVCMRLRAHFGIVHLLPIACEKHLLVA